MGKRLYRKKGRLLESPTIERSDLKFGIWRPSFCNWRVPGECRSLRAILQKIYFMVLSAGRFQVAYVLSDDGELVHTSYIIGSRFKFRFMTKQDFEIGPCYTKEKFRGQGIYPSVLRVITSLYDVNFYMNVDESNVPSIRGIEKAGFSYVGHSIKTRFLKIYHRLD